MRKINILFILLAFVATTTLHAQKQKKPNVGKAEAIVNKAGTAEITDEELVMARTNADGATTYEKTMNKNRTWFVRGMVYKLIYEKGGIEGVDKVTALTAAGESFNKAVELGKETDLYSSKSTLQIESLWGTLLNDGVTFYNDGDKEAAATSFEYTTLIKPSDTTGYLYAGSSASELQDWDRAEKNYKKLVELAPKEGNFVMLISVQKDGKKDFDAAFETIAKAKEVLGDDAREVGKYEIDLLIATDKVSEAITQIEKAITVEPENSLLHLRKALLFDQLANAERKSEEPNDEKIDEYVSSAQAAYDQTIKIDPKNVTAYFNYAIIYNDKANKLYNALGLMSPSEDRKKRPAYEKEARTYLEQALPLMEKAYEIEPEDEDILFALESFYSRLDVKDKLKEVQEKMKSLGYIEN